MDLGNLPSIYATNNRAGRTTMARFIRPGVGGMYLTGAGGTPTTSAIGVTTSTGADTDSIFMVLASSLNYSIGNVYMATTQASTPAFYVNQTNNRVSINKTIPMGTLDVDGNASITGRLAGADAYFNVSSGGNVTIDAGVNNVISKLYMTENSGAGTANHGGLS